MKLFKTTAMCIALAFSIAFANNANAAYDGVAVENATPYKIRSFLASPSDSNYWSLNLLAYEVLPGDIALAFFEKPGTSCFYDFRTTFSNGVSIDRYNVNICQIHLYTLH